MFEILKKPYPSHRSTSYLLGLSVGLGLFVSFFLIIFQPFGLHSIKGFDTKWLIISGYGAITFICLIINSFLFPLLIKRFFFEENWTVAKHILWTLWIIFSVGAANYIYTELLFNLYMKNWIGFVIFQFITLAVGIIPVTFITMIEYNRLHKQNTSRASDLMNVLSQNEQKETLRDQKIFIESKSGTDQIELILNDLCYIKAEGNYISIFYKSEDKMLRKTIRQTIADVEALLTNFPFIMRVHKSYLLNLNKVDQVEGNSQGYKISVSGIDDLVPVSRNYIKEFNKMIEGHA